MWINDPTAGREFVNATAELLGLGLKKTSQSIQQRYRDSKAAEDQARYLRQKQAQHLYSTVRQAANRYGTAQATKSGDIQQVFHLSKPDWTIKIEGTRVSIEDILGQKLYVASDKEVIEDNLSPQELAIFQELELHIAEEIALANGNNAQAALAQTYQQMGVKPQDAREAARIRTQVDGFRSRTLEENLLMQEVHRQGGLLEPEAFNRSVAAIRTLDTAKALLEAYGEGETSHPSNRQYQVGPFHLHHSSGEEKKDERVLITHTERGRIAELSNGKLQSHLTPTDVAEFERARAQMVQTLSLELNKTQQNHSIPQPQRISHIER